MKINDRHIAVHNIQYTCGRIQYTCGRVQQVTTPTPTTKLNTKNPKRVAAGKATAEKTRLAREAQKRAFADANIRADRAEKKLAETKNKTNKAEELEEPTPQHSSGRAPFSLWIAAAGVVVAGVGVAVTLVTHLFKPEKVKAFLGWTTR